MPQYRNDTSRNLPVQGCLVPPQGIVVLPVSTAKRYRGLTLLRHQPTPPPVLAPEPVEAPAPVLEPLEEAPGPVAAPAPEPDPEPAEMPEPGEEESEKPNRRRRRQE